MKDSKIEWCDHTLNFWVGCEKISPACDHCYAERWANRTGAPELWQGQRRRTRAPTWNAAYRWNSEVAGTGARPPRVFTNSLADFFDNAVPDEWRADAWQVIRNCTSMTWLILTKRAGNVARMLPPDWGEGWPHVWLGMTAANQAELERDWPKLARVPAAVHFWSLEPLLGEVNPAGACELTADEDGDLYLPDWIIVGGESGGQARPMSPAWVHSVHAFCVDFDVPFFFKQWGEWMPDALRPRGTDGVEVAWIGDQPMARVGRARAGRVYLEHTHDEFPDQRGD